MIDQSQAKNFSYATLTEIKAATGREGEICHCIETETTYRYLVLGSSYTANDQNILITGNGGNTRWVGISGKYTTNDYIVDQNGIQYRMNVTETYPTFGVIATSPSYGGDIFAMDADSTYIYIGGATTRKVRKVLKTDLSTVAETANYGGNIFRVEAQDPTYFYYLGGSTAFTVIKARKSDMATVNTSANFGAALYGLARDSTHVYVGRLDGQITKLLATDLSTVATSTTANDSSLYGLALDSTYVYTGGSGSASGQKIFKYDKATLTKQAESSVVNKVRQLIYDGSYLYCCGGYDGVLYKIDPSDMSIVASVTTPESQLQALDYDSEYVYCGYTYLSKYRKSDLKLVFTSATGYDYLRCCKPDSNSEVYQAGATAQTIKKTAIRARQTLNYYEKVGEL
jgi:hypothetical protein